MAFKWAYCPRCKRKQMVVATTEFPHPVTAVLLCGHIVGQTEEE